MKKKLKEKISLFIVMNPRGAVLAGILLLNVALILISSLLIKTLMLETVGDVGYLKTVYYTICMLLDAGTIENVIADVGTANAVLVIICILTIILGMITFTGAAIGYVTNYISNFIENANSYARPIHISDHTVILNWNSRASEIINDMLYLKKRETIVVLVNSSSEEVKREINERLYLTLKNEKKLKNLLKIVVREGNTYSGKQLNDISLLNAKTVIILGENEANTIKTLVQVAEITSSETSMDNQKIIVEVEDSWTESVVKKIISHKERLGKCNIVPVPVNKVLGQLLSQFCIFPELNQTYSELLSNKGASFFHTAVEPERIGSPEKEKDCIREVLYKNDDVIPLSFMTAKTGRYLYYMANSEKDFRTEEKVSKPELSVEINKDYWIEQKNVIILGHNSKIKSIMDGFDSFRSEWNRPGEKEIVNIMIIDDSESLKKNDYFRDYSYVEKVVEAEIYDTELIKKSINEFVDAREEDTSILILSDDMVPEEDIDSYALTNLIYVQDLIFEKLRDNPDFDRDKIDLIVEILNPKNYDVVHNYNISNIVISNRYISKMITQIGEKIELYEFYEDTFTYDEIDDEKSVDGVVYESKEVYVKKVPEFLKAIPPKCTAMELIRALYEASPEDNRAFLLGVAKPGGVVEMFDGRQSDKTVELSNRDKLIMYCNH